MLRLNYSSIERTTSVGVNTVCMLALFDDVTKAGKVKRKHAKRFDISNGILKIDGTEFQLSDDVDLNADPEALMAYFDARYLRPQPDMFAELPKSNSGWQAPKLLKEVHWEYPDLPWRAVDKAGAVAYFKQRPVLDKAGYWVSASIGVMPKYGKSLCIADSFECSLRYIDKD